MKSQCCRLCDSPMRWLSHPDREQSDAGSDRNRRLASAGERGGAHLDLAVAERATTRRQRRIPHPGRVFGLSGADLSGVALGVAARARDRPAHRNGPARCDPYRNRRADRSHGAGLLPKARPPLPRTGLLPSPRATTCSRLAETRSARGWEHSGTITVETSTSRSRFWLCLLRCASAYGAIVQ